METSPCALHPPKEARPGTYLNESLSVINLYKAVSECINKVREHPIARSNLIILLLYEWSATPDCGNEFSAGQGMSSENYSAFWLSAQRRQNKL